MHSLLSAVHPSARLWLWLVVVLAIQWLPFPMLAGLTLLFAAAGASARERWWRLIRRVRYVLLSLCLIFAYGVPGDALGHFAWAPTEEGVSEALWHGLRLVLMVGSVAVLLDALSPQEQVAGLWRGLALLPISAENRRRAAVRLMLTLAHQQSQAPRAINWRTLLDEACLSPAAPGVAERSVCFELPAWRARDTFCCLFFSGLLLAGVLW